jgi:hypothetical protein
MPFKISKECPIYIIRVEVNSALQMEVESSIKMFMIFYKIIQYHIYKLAYQENARLLALNPSLHDCKSASKPSQLCFGPSHEQFIQRMCCTFSGV